jgi:hypothetical protein
MLDYCVDYGPGQVLVHDELRTGTRTELGRNRTAERWSPAGHRPLASVQIGYEYTYLYLAFCPFGTQAYAAFLPALTGEHFSWFVGQINAQQTRPCLFIADGAKAQQASAFESTQRRFCKLPPYCPELNPAERAFREIRRRLKHRLFASLAEAQLRVKAILIELYADTRKWVKLVCFPYIQEATSSF